MGGPRLLDKVAIVTGSTRGVGEGIAHLFAEEGAKVVVCGRSVDDGLRVRKEIEAAGGTAVFEPLDLAEEDSVKAVVEATIGHFGALHVLINNAAPTDLMGFGGNTDNSVEKLTTEGWRKIMTSGLDGLFWMCHYAVPEIIKSGAGSIVNISSGVATLAVGGSDAYTATKGAMNALTRSMAVNLAPFNIRVNTCVVGPVATPGMAAVIDTPALTEIMENTTLLKRMATPRECAYGALYLASDESSFVTGTQFAIDGGLAIRLAVPALA